MSDPVVADPWARLRGLTPARIGLGRAGSSLPTAAALAFALDHARARDAVHTPFDAAGVAQQIGALGLKTLRVDSAAATRQTYLLRPDLGRALNVESRTRLATLADDPCDLAIIVADGLSAAAAHAHAAPLIAAFEAHRALAGWTLAPIILASQARVALGDEVGQLLRARLVVVMLGERPGLSSPDSLGLYLTLDPRPGRRDAERNCISNVRPAGLSYETAAAKLAWHVRHAFTRGLTGVRLKDESEGWVVDSRIVEG